MNGLFQSIFTSINAKQQLLPTGNTIPNYPFLSITHFLKARVLEESVQKGCNGIAAPSFYNVYMHVYMHTYIDIHYLTNTATYILGKGRVFQHDIMLASLRFSSQIPDYSACTLGSLRTVSKGKKKERKKKRHLTKDKGLNRAYLRGDNNKYFASVETD